MPKDLEELQVNEVLAAPTTPEADDIVDSDIPAPQEAEPHVPGPVLSDRDLQMLAFEQQWWRHAGAKEQAIKDTFQLSATRYYQALNVLLENPAALAAQPLLVGRLLRLRQSRSRTRG
ncbi:hypothetical protein F4553_004056 [Allocatelliglobosispora scoriae]|uniref:DUF3263 domain-containing protein n=2 Tax=Allocatelliglobosispora scoriae TaxID=643052 RepID=A0A841BNL2_9ACTN|nr:DUF3263 domain-containing protein [Allocatelliglobosispora scoriae]MBB5870677.1 hypothetical protein [Allocatelliglobosispora scoriae]